MTSVKPFPTFAEFIQSLSSTRYETIRTLPSAEVESEPALIEMKQHLRATYDGVEVVHSFMDDAGFVIDCVPYEKQPARLGTDGPAPIPPKVPEMPDVSGPPGANQARCSPPPLHPEYRDIFGNQMWCPCGTVPILRTTLEQIARRRTLSEFHRKQPPEALGGEKSPPEARDNGHRYATAETRVANIGGSSYINVWKPLCLGVQNSISQHWYPAGAQSLECGWQVCPANWNGSAEPHLFIYYTTHAHDPGTGGFNLNFEYQPNVPHYLGQALRISMAGSGQFEDEMGFLLDNGRWWFRFNGEWLGFLPASVFGTGPLVSGAERATFGGEAAGIGFLPPMGSGAFPEQGFGKAAYQRNVLLYQSTHSEIATLSVTDIGTSPCYRISVANNSPTDWGTFFYFGGQGGLGC